jgi:RNA polymerase-interacting CarD/CdnL/TRCF family regulator
MFEIGDPVVHPIRGAGVIVGIEERKRSEDQRSLYYRIELLGQPGIRLMIPVEVAEARGMRRVIAKCRLKEVWQVLRAKPQRLPQNNNKRYQLIREKLRAGDVFQVTEAVRDMAWRRKGERGLTTVGKRIFDEGLSLLAAEVAASRDANVEEVKSEIHKQLRECIERA